MAPRSASTWLALDVLFLSGKRIRPLGRKFKAGGPCAVVCLLCAAKVQDDEGRAVMSWTGLVDGAYLSSVRVAKAIVTECVDVGLLEVLQDDGTDFQVRFFRWDDWQRTDRTAAERMRRYRARKKERDAVTEPNGTSDVTARNSVTDTEQDKTEQNNKRPSGGMRSTRDAGVHWDFLVDIAGEEAA